MKATFFRKANNISDLKTSADPTTEFVIEKLVQLSQAEFDDFKGNLLRDYDFIEELHEFMYVDRDGVWHCIAVMSEDGGEVILSQSDGYSYSRYSAYHNNVEDIIVSYKANIFPEACFKQLMAVRNSGEINMFDALGVQRIAVREDYDDLYSFIEYHRKEYSHFILTGELM